MTRGKGALPVVLALCLLYVVVAAALGTGDGASQPAYTVFGTGGKGASVLFDALKAMNYPVRVGFSPIGESTSKNDIVVIIEPSPLYFSESDMSRLLSWVRGGGRLIFFGGRGERGPRIESGFDSPAYYEDEQLALYAHGLGEALVGDPEVVTNAALKDDPSVGVFIHRMIDLWGCDAVVFNESVHGFRQSAGFFGILPIGLKLLLYQLGLVTLMTVWRLGKRFGRPVPYYEELEREESESVTALAVIYKNAGKGEAALESYYEHFLQASAVFFGVSPAFAEENIESLWRARGLPHADSLAQARQAVSPGHTINTRRRLGRAELSSLIRKLNKLTAQVAQRYK